MATETDRKMPVSELTEWKALLKVAESYQKKKGNFASASGTQDGRWDINIKALDGDFNSAEELGTGAVDVNVTHATIQTLLSPLWTTVPYISVKPTCAKYEDGDEIADNILRARLTEYELNYWFRELQINRVNKKCVLDNAACNAGYAYLGYIKTKSEIENAEGEATENEPQVRLKAPFVKRICPKNILFPTGYYDFEELPWVAIGWLRAVVDVRDKYEIDDIKADAGLSDRDMDSMDLTGEMRDSLTRDGSGYVMVWQVWDKRSGKLVTLTSGHEDALEIEDWPLEVDGFPLVKQRFTWTPDQQFGMPMMSAWVSQQKELNAARTATGQREARTKAGVHILNAPEGFVDAYKRAGDGYVIDVKMDVDDIRKVLQIDPGLPPAISAYNYGSTQLNDIFLISGLGQQQRGQGDPNIDSATASALVDKWAQIRQTDMGDTVRTFYLDIARKLWMILKQFPDTKRTQMVLGPDGGLQHITYTLKELRGQFQFEMDLSSMYTEDPMTKQRNAMARYNLLRADPLVRGEKLVADMLSAGNIYDTASYLTTLLSPQEEFMKMLSGLPVEANELDDHMGHMPAHDQQGTQLEKLIATSQAGSPEETKGRTTMFLLLAHVNDHARLMAEMDTKKGKRAGQPMAENTLRADTAQVGAGETQAEMTGGSQDGPPPVATPGGIAAG